MSKLVRGDSIDTVTRRKSEGTRCCRMTLITMELCWCPISSTWSFLRVWRAQYMTINNIHARHRPSRVKTVYLRLLLKYLNTRLPPDSSICLHTLIRHQFEKRRQHATQFLHTFAALCADYPFVRHQYLGGCLLVWSRMHLSIYWY